MPTKCEQVLELLQRNRTLSTKRIATLANVSVKEAYKICLGLEDRGLIEKFGYRVAGGFEDVKNSNKHLESLTWFCE